MALFNPAIPLNLFLSKFIFLNEAAYIKSYTNLFFCHICRNTLDKRCKRSHYNNNRQLSLNQIPLKGPKALLVPRKALFVQHYRFINQVNDTSSY